MIVYDIFYILNVNFEKVGVLGVKVMYHFSFPVMHGTEYEINKFDDTMYLETSI